MKRKLLALLILLLVAAVAAFFLDPTKTLRGLLRGETFFGGRPSSYWAGAISSSDPATQSNAVNKLADSGETAVPVLIELLNSRTGSDSDSVAVRVEAMNLLGKANSNHPKAMETLLRGLKDADGHVRTLAAKAFGSVPGDLPDAAIAPLIEMLSTRESRLPAVFALSRFKSRAKDAVPELRKLLAETEPELRWNLSRTLGKIGPASIPALPDLYPHFDDKNEAVREHAAEAVGDMGPGAAAAIPYLEKAMADPQFKVRRDAVRSMGQLGEAAKGSLAKMKPLLEDESNDVREAARKALRIVDPSAKVEGK